MYGFSPVWINKWFLKLPFWWNPLPHTSQMNSLVLLCVRRCVFNVEERLNDLWHIVHRCGRSAVWIILCRHKVLDKRKLLPQMLHKNGFSPSSNSEKTSFSYLFASTELLINILLMFFSMLLISVQCFKFAVCLYFSPLCSKVKRGKWYSKSTGDESDVLLPEDEVLNGDKELQLQADHDGGTCVKTDGDLRASLYTFSSSLSIAKPKI